MIRIGMIVGERYEILEKIGTGGMSDVYKAKDHKLNRFVAVKVLKQEFGENANFVSKFRVEAQAAAGLMHPNIVNVYDVGEENGIHYIVMELVEGITLKKYIEKKARLSVKEAVSIAIQVSMGIEAAHNNHIIHRDIKPQNIIISKEGKVKVTDFGIAKAATSNTITSNVMGSVHYTSPEQARGGYSDEKSDVYSLGITMFEMLTGRVPFNGETTVAIAIKHIQEELPSPREYVAEIPISVEQIVFKCCQKSADRRYQSMGELVVDLKQSLINPDDDFVKVIDPDEEASTKMITDRDIVQIKKQSDRRDSMDKEMRLRKNEKRSARMYDEDDEEAYYKDDDEDEDYDPKMERLTTILAIVAALLVGSIIIFMVGRAFGMFHFGGSGNDEEQEAQDGQVEMIEVVGHKLEEIRKELIDLGLIPEIQYDITDEYEEGIVIRASVDAGDMVEIGTNVVLTVAQGSNGVNVPNVTGKSRAEAVSMLDQAGFVVSVMESYDSAVESGYVISQSPEADTTAPAGSSIMIRVSQGAENNKVRVPDVIGQSEEDAVVILTESGLTVGTISQVNHEDAALKDRVCYQSYSVGSYVDKDTVIDLRVSIGPSEVTYRYTDPITAPTEDPDYHEGIPVNVVVTTADGTQLLNTQTAAFPVSVNYAGIKSATGTIEFTFTVTVPGETINNEDGTTTTESSTVEKKYTRPITFTQE